MTDKNKDALLPCPFCGSDPDWKRWEIGGYWQIKIFCDGEFCHVHPSIFGNEKSVREIWNTRTAPAPVVDLEALKRDVCPRNKWIGKPENDCFGVGWNHCIDHLAARGLIGGVPELYALELEGFRDMVRYLLPLAKGYVHAHPGIRSTECLIEDAEAMLAAAPEPQIVPAAQHWVTVSNDGARHIVVKVDGVEVIRDFYVSGETELHHSYNITDILAAAPEPHNQAEVGGDWLPEEEWHEDYHDCVFVFMTKCGEFHHAIFSHPLSSDYPKDKNLVAYFHRVDTRPLWDIAKRLTAQSGE